MVNGMGKLALLQQGNGEVVIGPGLARGFLGAVMPQAHLVPPHMVSLIGP